jgi:hypothetical protein
VADASLYCLKRSTSRRINERGRPPRLESGHDSAVLVEPPPVLSCVSSSIIANSDSARSSRDRLVRLEDPPGDLQPQRQLDGIVGLVRKSSAPARSPSSLSSRLSREVSRMI